MKIVNQNAQKIIGHLLYLAIKLINSTYRYRVYSWENWDLARKKSPHQNYIYAVWHQSVVPTLFAHVHTKPHALLVSRSSDGELMSYNIEKIGHHPVRGSSSRGGLAAAVELIRLIKSGMPAAITVDGPRGPMHQVKSGVIEIAKKSGAPILPIIGVADRYWSFSSWDKFRLPKPFAKIIVYWMPPIFIPEDCSKDDFEMYQAKVKESLHTGEQLLLEKGRQVWNTLERFDRKHCMW